MLVATATHAQAEDDAERGRMIAEKHCSRCHVVGDFNKHGGISSTPSFSLLVNALEDYALRFRTFYARPPHPPFLRVKGFENTYDLPPNAAPFEIEIGDVENILAYAETLKKAD